MTQAYSFENTRAFAQYLDQNDVLRHFRERFHIPQHEGQEVIYLCGNSLGLQPKTARHYLETEMQKWQERAVEGHFEGENRWYDYHKALKPTLAHIVGALPEEVTIMNNLTSNLHFMLASFYQPQGARRKVLMEAGAFPSDQYALETHLRLRGIAPEEHLIEIAPRSGEHLLRTEDILQHIEALGEELALVMFGGINYYTGQVFEMEAISQKAHAVGAMAGFDLAHAAGNIELKLHDWQVDFAVWCSYKYLNSSPGGVAGAFVHQKHHHSNLPRMAGWWGHDEQERFLMKKGFVPMQGADGWQLANEPILLMAAHKAALEIFAEAGMPALLQKSRQLTAWFEYLLRENCADTITIITPTAPEQRGCQLSLLAKEQGKELFNNLVKHRIIGDWREPNVIRLAPTPLYNTFEEVYEVVARLQELL
jgi:kynureninase